MNIRLIDLRKEGRSIIFFLELDLGKWDSRNVRGNFAVCFAGVETLIIRREVEWKAMET